MAELFATSKQNIGQIIFKILKENELATEAVVKKYFTTASDDKRYNVVFYSLEMIIAVGYRVRGVRGTQFRQWATQHLSEYLVKGFTIDTERLKNPDGRHRLRHRGDAYDLSRITIAIKPNTPAKTAAYVSKSKMPPIAINSTEQKNKATTYDNRVLLIDKLFISLIHAPINAQ